jgi:hypothetical protein
MPAVALMTALATLPFLNKAFHIDDRCYLQIARHILTDPLRPYDFHILAGGREQAVFDYDWSPPLFKYVLAVGSLVFGESEVPLHIVMSVFTAGVAASIYALGRRFSKRPLLATAFLVLNPLFVPGQNLMLDVPMLSLGLGGLAVFVWGMDRGRLVGTLAGGLLAGLAVVTKYPALVALPLMVLYGWKRRADWTVLAVGVALVPFATWCLQNVVVHGRIHFLTQPTPDLAAAELAARGAAMVRLLGAAVFPLLIAPRLGLPWVWHALILMLSAGFATLVLWLHPRLEVPRLLVAHFAFLTSGAMLITLCLVTSLRRGASDPEQRYLTVWLLLGLGQAMAAPFLAVRHILWALPAAGLWVARALPAGRAASRWAVLGGGALTITGLAVARADMERANLIRHTVLERVRPQVAEIGQPVYYVGEHAFAYYSAAAGLRPLRHTTRDIPVGAFVIVAEAAHPDLPPRLRERLGPPWPFFAQGRLPLTTSEPGVSFYATGVVDLPWAVGTASDVYWTTYTVVRPETRRASSHRHRRCSWSIATRSPAERTRPPRHRT